MTVIHHEILPTVIIELMPSIITIELIPPIKISFGHPDIISPPSGVNFH